MYTPTGYRITQNGIYTFVPFIHRQTDQVGNTLKVYTSKGLRRSQPLAKTTFNLVLPETNDHQQWL